jgi:acetyl esterase
MPLPFKIKALLFLDKLMGQDIKKLSPAQARTAMQKSVTQLHKLTRYREEKLFRVEERPIVLRKGLIKARIYQPVQEEGLPLIMFFHGGGFVQGDVYTHDHNCRRLAVQIKAVVVSVEYRLAPEFPFPVPAEDCYEATCWAVEQAKELGIDPHKLVVMGDSAGGNLATVVCMMSRDRGGPPITAQVLIYPALDATLSMPSVNALAKGYFLTREKMEWYIGHYARNEVNKKHPYLSPLFAEKLHDLPPALIITAEFDPLIDDGEGYAEKLKGAGIPVEYMEYKGMIHAFFSMPGLLREARKAEEQVKKFILRHVNK